MKYLAPACLSVCLWMAACSSPTPVPTPTPIPAYVTGEEDLAYESFVQYYDENCWGAMHFMDGSSIHWSIDLSKPGRAVYVGDAIWRFRIIEEVRHSDEYNEGTQELEEEVITTRSLTDGSWENPCPGAGVHYEEDYLEDRDSPDDFEEPPDDGPFDGLRGHPDG